jgi:uncharacterized membrane protein
MRARVSPEEYQLLQQLRERKPARTLPKQAKHDYEVNQKAELEIELVQDKLTLLLEEEIVGLKTLLIEQQQQTLRLEAFLMERLQK